ncbi:MAG: zinc ribbon domain-containing protein [Candidatus Bathyarchaeia archaeon]
MVPLPASSQYLTCPNCRSQLALFSNYCNICGTPVRQPILLKICPQCKSRISHKAKFCPECGKKQEFGNNQQHPRG